MSAREDLYASRRRDKVLVRVVVFRQELEEREDVDGEMDFYVVKNETVSTREWWEDRREERE